jgi:hypothetical protein
MKDARGYPFGICAKHQYQANTNYSYKEKHNMNKTKYVEPKMEIIRLHTEDILTTSTEAFDGVWVPIGAATEDDIVS